MLQYLYYLARVGISVSPLSNKALFIDDADNPFDSFFARGLLVVRAPHRAFESVPATRAGA